MCSIVCCALLTVSGKQVGLLLYEAAQNLNASVKGTTFHVHSAIFVFKWFP